MRDQRYQGGLWAALFLILVLPVLLGFSWQNPRLSLPVGALKVLYPELEKFGNTMDRPENTHAG